MCVYVCICQVFKKSSGKESSQCQASQTVHYGDSLTFIKVVNMTFNMSCLWPVSKLKEKLVKLRTLVYAVRMCHPFLAKSHRVVTLFGVGEILKYLRISSNSRLIILPIRLFLCRFFASFNNIMEVLGHGRDEVMAVQLKKRLLSSVVARL